MRPRPTHHKRSIFHAVYSRDIGVIQRCQNLRFAGEAGHSLGILREGLRKNFDGDLALELRVCSSIYLAHTALAQLAADVIVRDGFPDHFFSPASQFTTTFKNCVDVDLLPVVFTRNRFPSAVRSY
jgi:hypothetical protein